MLYITSEELANRAKLNGCTESWKHVFNPRCLFGRSIDDMETIPIIDSKALPRFPNLGSL